MSVLSDKWIKKMSLEKKMIAPFVENQNRGDNISFGLSSYGTMLEFQMNLKFLLMYIPQ